MEAQYKSSNGRLAVKIDAPDVKGLFRSLATIQSSLEAESECGICKSKEILYSVRVHDESEYFELICSSCGSQFGFGQHKKGGTLFPKRKNEKGENLPNRGWYKWSGNIQGSSRPQGQHVSDDDIPF